MSFRKLTSLLLIAYFSIQSTYAAELKIPNSVNLSVTKVKLDNGLTILIHEDHKSPIVSVNVWYHVGSKNEPKGKNGFAHLFEHLMFQGSENYNDDYFKATQAIGATDFNGTTNEDRTNYFQTVPTTALDTVLFLESDRMGHFVNSISQGKLNEQRKVVLNEKRERAGTPYAGIAEEKIAKGCFPDNHPYSWTTIGSEEDLNNASIKDVKDWFQTYYGPNNATLTIVGDINTQETLEKVKKYFGDIPANPRISRMKQWIAKRTETTTEIVEDNVPYAKLMKIYNIPGMASNEFDAIDSVSDVLTIGKNSRMFKDLVYDKQLANDVNAAIYPGEIASLFVIDATAKEGVNVDELDRAIQETMNKFLKDGPSEEELKRVKTQYLANFIQSLEKIGGHTGISNLLAMNEVFLGDPSAYQKNLRDRMALTTTQIKNSAQKWLSSGDYNLRIMPYPKYKTTASTIDRKKLPLPDKFPDGKFPKVEETTLSNGIRVLLAHRTHIPSVEIAAMMWTGFSKDPKDKKGLAHLTFDLLNEGTTQHSLFEISNSLANLGSVMSSFSGMNLSGIYFRSLKQNLDPTLGLLAEQLLSPGFPEKELVRIRKTSLQEIAQEKADPENLSNRIFGQLMFGRDHPYASFSGTGTEKSIASITRNDVVNFYNTWAKPNNTVVIAVGDITMSELTSKLEQHFSTWKKGSVPVVNIPDIKVEANPGTLFLIDQPYAQQTQVWAGQFYPSLSDPKAIPNFLMNGVLGGGFVSRINLNLREDKGWVYGAFSRIVDLQGKRMLIAMAPVQFDKTDDAIVELQKEFTGMATQSKPITQDEFEKLRKSMVIQFTGIWETNGSLFDPLKRLVYNNMDPNFYQTYSQKLQSATLNDVVDSARTVLHPDRMVWLLVGDKNKILPKLEKLKFNKIVVLDEDGNVSK